MVGGDPYLGGFCDQVADGENGAFRGNHHPVAIALGPQSVSSESVFKGLHVNENKAVQGRVQVELQRLGLDLNGFWQRPFLVI